MNHVDSRQMRTRRRGFVAAAVTFLGVAGAQAQTVVLPGTTTQIDISTTLERCVEDAPSTSGIPATTTCLADADALDGPPLRVLAASGLSSDPDSFFGQTVVSVATLFATIQIPVPAGGAYSPVLPVQIATEVTWSGGTVVAGIDSTFAQVVATFQVRDITDAAANPPGPVVASDTFLFERTDADFEIIIPDELSVSAIADFLNLINIVDISNSSGTDFTALLVRGRTYALELEAKCDVQVPIFGFGACLFSSDVLTDLGLPDNDLFPALENDGFSATNISVTVGSDPVENLLGSP